jgi:hypothetical protein
VQEGSASRPHHRRPRREVEHAASLRELRQKLGQNAKQLKRLRCYSLHGLVSRNDVLEAAWAALRRNDGAPGVEGVSIGQIAATPESEAVLGCLFILHMG